MNYWSLTSHGGSDTRQRFWPCPYLFGERAHLGIGGEERRAEAGGRVIQDQALPDTNIVFNACRMETLESDVSDPCTNPDPPGF